MVQRFMMPLQRRPLRDTSTKNTFAKFQAVIDKKFEKQLADFDEEEYRQLEYLKDLFTFLDTGSLDVSAGLLVDTLSIMFALLITGVGALIHVYSIGYMAHDVRRRRFFGYLNLFIAAMLVLVLSDTFLGVFLGWEGVGLASYLLIGWYQGRPSAATAATRSARASRLKPGRNTGTPPPPGNGQRLQ